MRRPALGLREVVKFRAAEFPPEISVRGRGPRVGEWTQPGDRRGYQGLDTAISRIG